MTDATRIKVGILSDSPLQRHTVQHAVTHYGLEVGLSMDPIRLSSEVVANNSDIALWLLETEDEISYEQAIDLLFSHSEAEVLFGIGMAPEQHHEDYPLWERRLYQKMREIIGLSEALDSKDDLEALDSQPARQRLKIPRQLNPSRRPGSVDRVWILAASLGGPAAVKAFIDVLPDKLPVAFVYAQHIDSHFSDVLVKVLTRHSSFELKAANSGQELAYGVISMMPVDRELIFDHNGRFVIQPNEWPGPYGPSIDQVLLNVANHYGDRCNVIFFSGMGNDGAIAAPILKAYGCRIWTQTPASCANSSMPEAVAETGCASFTGTPEELAAKLVEVLNNDINNNSDLVAQAT